MHEHQRSRLKIKVVYIKEPVLFNLSVTLYVYNNYAKLGYF